MGTWNMGIKAEIVEAREVIFGVQHPRSRAWFLRVACIIQQFLCLNTPSADASYSWQYSGLPEIILQVSQCLPGNRMNGIQLPFPHHTLHFLQTITSFPKKIETSSCVPYHPTDSSQIRPETWRTDNFHLPSTWQQNQRTYGLLSTQEHYWNRTN